MKSIEKQMLEYAQRNTGWLTIDNSVKKAALSLESKGLIEIAKHEKATWQIKLK